MMRFVRPLDFGNEPLCMNRSQHFFRYLWRVNAVLIFIAAAAIAFGAGALFVGYLGGLAAGNREPASGLLVAGPQADPGLFLTGANLLPGTQVMRASLVVYRAGGGFSSGGYSDTRNLLFVAAGDKTARWLLPDHQHVITDSVDIMADEDDARLKRIVAAAALVRPSGDQRDAATGRLLLCDPAGRRIIDVANGVRKLHVASVLNGEVSLRYERDHHLMLVRFDAASLLQRGEEQVDVPQLR
jgi:hypothetical protein